MPRMQSTPAVGTVPTEETSTTSDDSQNIRTEETTIAKVHNGSVNAATNRIHTSSSNIGINTFAKTAQFVDTLGSVQNLKESFQETAASESTPETVWNSLNLGYSAGDTLHDLFQLASSGNNNAPQRDDDEEQQQQNEGTKPSTISKLGRCCRCTISNTFHCSRRMYVWIMTGIAIVTALTGVSLGALTSSLFRTKKQEVQEICTFFGIPDVTLCQSVTSLRLSASEVVGSTIPEGIGLLTQLTSLTIYGTEEFYVLHQLDGAIPSTIGNLVNLTHLNLTNNALTGSIPTTIDSISALITLDLSSNKLLGTIPSSIGQTITKLSEIHLEMNSLLGTLPASLGNLVDLKTANFSSNEITGTIPSEIGNLEMLVELSLDNNKLNGTLPIEIEKATQLKYFNAGTNELTGTIPSRIGELVQLTELSLHANAINGTIPSEIGNLENLLILRLSENDLIGSIPSTIGNIVDLTELYLNDNQLTGEIPSSFVKLSHLEFLYLYNNHRDFNDTLPETFCAAYAPTDLICQTDCSDFYCQYTYCCAEY